MTGLSLDQLLFTWTQHGVDGKKGFQVVAATPALVDPAHPQRVESLELCRYRVPQGLRDPAEAPVSYGWIDLKGSRYLFHKVYLGNDDFGRPGNFAAHVVVGRPEALPVKELVACFDSSWWWCGEPVDGHALAEVTLADITPGRDAPAFGHDPAGLVEAVFAVGRRRRIAIRDSPRAAITVITALADQVPWLADSLSFSTYESSDTAPHFEVVGVGVAGPIPPAALVLGTSAGNPEATAAARVVLSPDPEDQAVTKTSLAVAAVLGSLDIEVMVDSVQAFTRLQRDGVVDVGKLRAALSSVDGIRALTGFVGGVTALAGVVVSGGTLNWQAVRRVCGSKPEVERALSDAVAAEVFSRSSWSAVDALHQRLGSGAPELVGPVCLALCGKASTTPMPVRQVGAAGAIALLRGLGTQRSNIHSAVLEQLALAAAQDAAVALRPTQLDLDTRGRILARALERPDVDIHLLVAAVADSLPLVGAAVGHLRRPEVLGKLLPHVDDRTSASIAHQVLARLDTRAGYDFFSEHVRRVPTGQRLTLLAECLPLATGDVDQRWSEIVQGALNEMTAMAMSSAEEYNEPPQKVVRLVSEVSCGPVGEVLARLRPESPGVERAGSSSAWVILDELRADKASVTAAELALTLLFHGRPTAEQLSDVAGRLHHVWPSDKERVNAVLAAALRRRDDGGQVAGIALLYTAQEIAAGRLRSRLGGQLDSLARDLVMRCHGTHWVTCRARVLRLGGDAEKWWLALNKTKNSWFPVVGRGRRSP